MTRSTPVALAELRQRWAEPAKPRPIVFIGAGGIVNDAHLPAYTAMMLAVKDAIDRGALGRIVEFEVHVNCRMPWELWPFMQSLERMEIALHSIHYLDFIRSILGEPRSVFARTVKHPNAMKLASSRT